jgi:hypothetical protein
MAGTTHADPLGRHSQREIRPFGEAVRVGAKPVWLLRRRYPKGMLGVRAELLCWLPAKREPPASGALPARARRNLRATRTAPRPQSAAISTGASDTQPNMLWIVSKGHFQINNRQACHSACGHDTSRRRNGPLDRQQIDSCPIKHAARRSKIVLHVDDQDGTLSQIDAQWQRTCRDRYNSMRSHHKLVAPPVSGDAKFPTVSKGTKGTAGAGRAAP